MKDIKKKSCRFLLVGMILGFLILSFLMSEGSDQFSPSPTSQKTKLWSPEDILLAESASSWQISPDGKWAVWVKSRMDKEKNGRISNLFLTNLETGQEIQLTRTTENDSQPKWSPDGQLISFLSTRPLPKAKPEVASTQLWLINPFGGEPYPVTELSRVIRSYDWLDKETIIFSAQEDPTFYEQELKKKKDTSRVVDDVDHEPPVRLFKLTIKDKKITRLTDNRDFIRMWASSPDGKMVVSSHHQYLSFEWDHRILPKTFLYNFETGERKELLAGQRILPQFFSWSKDGSGFYLVAPLTTDPRFFTASITILYFYDVSQNKLVQVDLGWPRGLAERNIEVTPDGFIALLADGVKLKLARYLKKGLQWLKIDLKAQHAGNIFDFTVSEDGRRIVYLYTTASLPPQYYVGSLTQEAIENINQITKLNPNFKDKFIARTEIVRWKGALGEEIEGILYYPINYEVGKRYPLLVAPHGGPAAADTDSWDESYAYPQQLLCQRGAFVFKPNYHGSSNYGLKFVESIKNGKYYDYPIEDIEKGVDYLIDRGLVDPNKIGAFGWSNGSILSIGLSVHNPKRYKVIGAGAGDVEFISDWANVDFGHSFDTYYFGKSPLEDPILYIKISPFFKLDRVEAPTIIFFGTEDRNVPTDQGWSHYRALYHLGKVPVKFILFPGEAHGLRQLSHQLRKVEEEMAWFDRYFFNTWQAKNEAFKEDSPLGWSFRLRKAARDGLVYGIKMTNGPLIPEVVKRGEIAIGRFEVTRAQYAAFDPSYKFPPGTENYPANGINFEQAKAYVDWLTKVTGEVWRLPQEEEMAQFYVSRENENTLDFWAGYKINPDDALRLREKLKELGEGAPLLKEVGSFPGSGSEEEDFLFDLGGNVAEWVISQGGRPKIMGGSADRPSDQKGIFIEPTSDYIGFRVIKVLKEK
ncbi:MAG: prolyl oligopeptidase family serine peptidase [Candidatus Aminicenantes bacterium]|nr:prolyl oligopeptidase family serine peptidase [Candidatus Aminicenantes bacterium]